MVKTRKATIEIVFMTVAVTLTLTIFLLICRSLTLDIEVVFTLMSFLAKISSKLLAKAFYQSDFSKLRKTSLN